MKTITLILILTISFDCFAQDTIFSDAYPKGIIVDTTTTSVRPNKKIVIDKGEYRINIDKEEVIKITNSNGLVFQNKDYLKSMNLVVPVDPSTAKINYTEVIEVKGIKKKELYNALKVLPNSSTTYNLVSGDDSEFSNLFYRGSFFIKYAGDLHVLIFDINIKIKDEKIKYEVSNFRLYFSESKHTNMFGQTTNYSTLPTNVKNFPLEQLYSRGHRERWTEMWGNITSNINTTISTIKSSAKGAQTEW